MGEAMPSCAVDGSGAGRAHWGANAEDWTPQKATLRAALDLVLPPLALA